MKSHKHRILVPIAYLTNHSEYIDVREKHVKSLKKEDDQMNW